MIGTYNGWSHQQLKAKTSLGIDFREKVRKDHQKIPCGLLNRHQIRDIFGDQNFREHEPP